MVDVGLVGTEDGVNVNGHLLVQLLYRLAELLGIGEIPVAAVDSGQVSALE